MSRASGSKSSPSIAGLLPYPLRFGLTSVNRSASGACPIQQRSPPMTEPWTRTTRGPAPSVKTSRVTELAGFAVNDVLAAEGAVLLQLETVLVLALVLLRRVVPALALGAFHVD